MLASTFKNVSRQRRGASLLGYGLLVGLVGVVALNAVITSGSSVERVFCETAESLAGNDGSCIPLPPEPQMASHAFTVIEGSAIGTLVGQVSATDDLGVTGYTILSGDPSGYFEIAGNGEITVTAAGDGNLDNALIPAYTLTVEATDGDGHATEAPVTITVLDNVSNIMAWGINPFGHLGDGTSTYRAEPVSTIGGLDFAHISAGLNHMCGVTTGNEAYCWGHGGAGRTGQGNTPFSQLSPGAVVGGHSFVDLASGNSHTCAIDGAGNAWCWGSNASGQLGNGGGSESSVPVQVLGGLTFTQIGSGGSHSCGVVSGGAGYCWGNNGVGQLGNGGTTQASTPSAVSGGHNWRSIHPGGNSTCGVTTIGAIRCWGDNSNGKLGNGSTGGTATTPTLVSGAGSGWDQVTVGGSHVCGRDGTTAYCWGSGHLGRLGTGNDANSSIPVLVAGNHDFEDLAAGNAHTCAINTSGEAWCWGTGAGGQLGDGNNADSPVPVKANTPNGLVLQQVTGGGNHSHARY